MKTSESFTNIATALAAAQGGFTNPERNRTVKVRMKTGGEYSFTYATLDAILEMARPHLAANGLSLIQPFTIEDEWVVLTTRLMHSSGEFIEETLALRPEDLSPQSVGSVCTYAKRYQLCSLLGITAEEDDDGNHGSGNHAEPIHRGNGRPPAQQQQRPTNGNGSAKTSKSQQFEDFTFWLKDQIPSRFKNIGEAWTWAYGIAARLGHNATTLQQCTNEKVFTELRESVPLVSDIPF